MAHAMRERTQRLVFASALLALAPVIALKPVISNPANDDDAKEDGGPTHAGGGGWNGLGASRIAMPPAEKIAYYVGLGAAVGVASGVAPSARAP